MALNNLKEVYIDQLQDIYSACKQSKSVTGKLADAAKSADLKAALERAVSGIEDGMETISSIVKGHGEDPTGEHCKGMEGLVKEAQAHGLDADFSDDDVRDAMIITQYQRMAHYAIAGYGCCKAFAERLDLEDDAKKINTCLDASYDGDRVFTEIATSEVNKKAA